MTKLMKISLICLFLIAAKLTAYADGYTDYVNPLVGTMSKHELSHGNTYPAIAVPWGMNFWMPQTGKMGDGWAYRYDANHIRGFKQTHQPSPWINDYGQFSIMPVTGADKIDQDKRASWFSHKAETAKPHYYSVYLADHDIVTEITPTERAAYFRFTFPEHNESSVIIDAFDKGSYIEIIPERRQIIGYTTKNSGGVPENFKNYFVIEFDKPFVSNKVWSEPNYDAQKKLKDKETLTKEELLLLDEKFTLEDKLKLEGFHAGAIITFATKRGEKVHAKVASSFISYDQAHINLKELDNKGFDATMAKSKQSWEDVLGKIAIEGGTDAQKTTFYSCLYRSVLFPRMFYEINEKGEAMHYSPYNGQVLAGYMFTDTGFWDTFRSLFPLLNLVYPSMNEKMQDGLLNTYLESGFFPEWASPGHRNCMVGNNSASVLADAYLKGVTKADMNKIYEGVLYSANNRHPKINSTGRAGVEYYNKLGYVPYDVKINESAARTLEYAYDDWCIYKMAQKLNRPLEEQELYKKRALNYKNLFDKETNLMRGKNENGQFQSPFNPLKWGDAFTEGNSWHYTWSVFHDVQGLINLMGGDKVFVNMLDSVFHVPPIFDESYYGGVIHEIREMQIMNMGNYAHGNQPIQHMIYLYNYAKEPWKAQYWVREVMDRLYSPTPDGYCGDEDNGQTSAWYIFSAMGFYPVCPGADEYIIGSPLFNKMTLSLENGKKVVIEATDNNPKNRYVQNISYNNESHTKNFFNYSDLLKGANIKFNMGETPNKTRGINNADLPYSLTQEMSVKASKIKAAKKK